MRIEAFKASSLVQLNTKLPKQDTVSIISVQKLSRNDAIELQNLRASLTGLGFFYISECDIPPDVIDAVRIVTRQLFNLPLEVKQKMHLKFSDYCRGYSNLDEETTVGKPDFKETFDFGLEQEPVKNVQFLWQKCRGPNQWPEGIDESVKQKFYIYMEHMSKVGLVLIKAIAMVLELNPNDLAQYFQQPFELLRLIRYPPTCGEKQGIGVHTDDGFLTMILQDPNSIGGLQALSRNGNWVNIDPIPGTFAVNIGDALEWFSRGVLRATPHKVVNQSSSNDRNSIAYFMEPSLESKIGAMLMTENVADLPFYGEHVYNTFMNSFPSIYANRSK